VIYATHPLMHSLTHSSILPSGPTPICISFCSLLLIDRWLHLPVVVVVVVVVQLAWTRSVVVVVVVV
jgi:hypothetical protein